METKRCQHCHKLLRVDAQTCSRCGGYDFLPVTQTRTRHSGSYAASEAPSVPSNPTLPVQLSPHRAGHYSGLHPEDEPYQSSFLPVQRPPLSVQPALEVEEVEDLTFSTVPDASIVSAPIATPKRQVATFTPLPAPRQQRSTQTYRAPAIEQSTTERDLQATYAPMSAPTIVNQRPFAPATRPPGRRKRGKSVPLLLIASCLLFIVATGILAFLLLSSKPATQLKSRLFTDQTGLLRVHDTLLLSGSGFAPDARVTFTRDAGVPVLDTNGTSLQVRTFSTGNFFVSITISESWNVGKHVIYATDQQGNKASFPITVKPTSTNAPQLQLMPNHIDLGVDNAGVASHKSITLTNAGGGDVNWQASINKSDASWLTLTPDTGSFAGSEGIVITVNRGNLAPQPYTGHISFTQLGSNHPALVLTVTMGVNPASATSANLVLSNAAIIFTGDPVSNPTSQLITIQNTGGQSLNWTASLATADGGNWLALSSTSGYLGAGAVASMTVSAASAGLSAGTYQGTITFSYAGASATPVTVTLTVNPPPVAAIAISPGGLNFHALMGQSAPVQSFTITNSGNAPLNWGIIEDANGKTYAPVSQSSGTLAPSKSIAITVTPTISQASAGTLNALITVIDTDAGTPVKSQQVKVTFTIANQAVISLDQNQLTFNHAANIPSSTQTIMLTDTGSAPLDWAVTINNSSPIAWLSVDNSGGNGVNPGGVEFINVTCDSSHLSPGTFTASLTLRDTDAGTSVAPQTINVTVVVSP
ncbi:MAG TPA: choice-of-anchor D domain-containing protein [Ktedonobacteraceae bacterium]|nr:choice-of-anchor D domain-containing protein [Ktedonobacteraceae bacterium]